jgi:hypothetical protein
VSWGVSDEWRGKSLRQCVSESELVWDFGDPANPNNLLEGGGHPSMIHHVFGLMIDETELSPEPQ